MPRHVISFECMFILVCMYDCIVCMIMLLFAVIQLQCFCFYIY